MKKRNIVLLGLAIFTLAAVFVVGRPKETNKLIVNNSTHQKNDIELLMENVIEDIEIDGVQVDEIRYDENKTKEQENYISQETGKEAVAFSVDFSTSLFGDLGGLNRNSKYNDYSIIYVKNDANGWDIYSMGYA